eukprot:6182994-Pleurochrysis_carterae.AAC.3
MNVCIIFKYLLRNCDCAYGERKRSRCNNSARTHLLASSVSQLRTMECELSRTRCAPPTCAVSRSQAGLQAEPAKRSPRATHAPASELACAMRSACESTSCNPRLSRTHKDMLITLACHM